MPALPLSVDFISTHPAFLPALATFGSQMKATYDQNQRLAGNFGYHRRWLISQAAMALYWEEGSALTVSGLVAKLTALKVASPNTIRDFADELQAYGFLRADPRFKSVRPRHWAPTETVISLYARWFYANLALVDGLDGGSRARIFAAAPDNLAAMQPRLAWNCLTDPRWRIPPERIGLLVKSISGGLVMDQIIILVGHECCHNGRMEIPAIDAHHWASQMQISRTHLQRTLKKLQDAGGIGWLGRPFESGMWVEQTLIREYCAWQAVKSHYVDEAFQRFVCAD